MAAVQAATISQPFAPHAWPPNDTWLACTSQNDGSAWAIVWSVPETGNQTPPSSDRNAVVPPMTGPIDSGVRTCPKKIPIATNGRRPTRMRPVISNHLATGSDTPSEMPAAYRSTRVSSAIAYPVTTLARKYARTDSGVIRSWRFQPTARSGEMRAPAARIAFMVPNEARPTMKYRGAEMPLPDRFETFLLPPAMT